MTQEERDIREYYRLHADIKDQYPYNHLLASNGGPTDDRKSDHSSDAESFKPEREYEPPELFQGPLSSKPTVPKNKSTAVLDKKRRSFSRGANNHIPYKSSDSDDGGYNALTAGLDGNG